MKKIILFSVSLLLASYTWALTTITTGSITGSPFCGGATVQVPYTVDALAGTGNVFTAQLSDKSGSFSNPVNIGSVSKKGAGTIPATLPAGLISGTKYRIRVVSSNPVVIGSPNTTDLSINPQPTGVKVNTISACDAQVKWKPQPNAASFEVRYKHSSLNDWSSITNVGLATTYTFSSLNASTGYDFQVRAKCSNGDRSTWKLVSGTTTAAAIPTGVVVTDVGITTTTIDWADAPCAANYRVRYKEFTATDWQVYKTVSTSTITLTGLFPATDYQAQVATLTATNDSSAYTASSQWQTNYFKMSGEGSISSYSVYPNPSQGTFTLHLNAQDAGTSSEITIQNIYGQVVYTSRVNLSAGENEELISIPGVEKGLYLLQVKAGANTMKSTITIQ